MKCLWFSVPFAYSESLHGHFRSYKPMISGTLSSSDCPGDAYIITDTPVVQLWKLSCANVSTVDASMYICILLLIRISVSILLLNLSLLKVEGSSLRWNLGRLFFRRRVVIKLIRVNVSRTRWLRRIVRSRCRIFDSKVALAKLAITVGRAIWIDQCDKNGLSTGELEIDRWGWRKTLLKSTLSSETSLKFQLPTFIYVEIIFAFYLRVLAITTRILYYFSYITRRNWITKSGAIVFLLTRVLFLIIKKDLRERKMFTSKFDEVRPKCTGKKY